MWLWELLSNIGGIGTELGAFNTVVIISLGYLLRDRYKRIKAKVDPVYERNVEEIVEQHDKLWKEYEYKTRASKSGKQAVTENEVKAFVAQEIARLLASKEET